MSQLQPAVVPANGSAARQGELWGWRARDWAELQEPREAELFAAAIPLLAIGAGTRVLDVGCGAGVFCRLAAGHGADASGIDAAPPLVELARGAVPEAEFRVADMEALPFDSATFDVVTYFTSIQFAANRAAALAEGRRVAKRGARVAVFGWGPDERCELTALMRAWQPLLPPPPPAAGRPRPLSAPGALEELAAEAGLHEVDSGELETTWEYPDEETVVRAMLASAGGCLVVAGAGQEHVRGVTQEALAPFRTASGAYRIRNAWRYAIGRA